ncbi:metallopeptidase TldD-related protein [Silvibacterium sp.]|uniref:metallopeptidase TldD-related protein n=1 Tax=Silvibacterium sp. TaxID=1964179 RepID=UPI0039E2DB8A
MIRTLTYGLLGATLALPVFASAQVPQPSSNAADAQKDPVLAAMLAELHRNASQLQLQSFDKPYFIEYRIDDVTQYEATAGYGALVGEHETHRRVARVTVRVGDYKFDSSGERGDASLQIAALDNDPMALRYALWAATDAAYKNALNNLTAKQATLKSVQTPPQADDFSHEKPVVSIAALAHSDLDREAWKQLTVEATGLYQSDAKTKAFAAEVQTSEGSLQSRLRTEYLVNTEGTIVRKSGVEYRAEVQAQAQATDGMRLERSYSVSGETNADLGTAEHFHNGIVRMLTGLNDLRQAPVIADEYHGPVLLSGNASAHVFDELFARALAAHRPELGSSARTVGPFASSYHTRVLPDFMKVTDDPSLASFDGKPLLGAYAVDDEGVPAQAVTVVDSGRLQSYLMGREPIRDFAVSNGHARAATAGAAAPRVGVLHVESSETVAPDELEKKLVAMGKDQGLDSVYLVDTLSGTERPRTLYRIKVADGSRELVRGAQLGDVDLRLLRSGILAVGNNPYVANTFGDIPSSVIAPPVLFDDVTVKKAEQRNDKLPYYPPPQ